MRHQVERYDADGSDIGIGYQVGRDGRMIAYVSVFVYPAPALAKDQPAGRSAACAREFASIKHDILAREATATLVQEGEVVAPSPRFYPPGCRAVFTGGRARLGGTDQAVTEEADLFCYAGGRWLVAYRITSTAGDDAAPEVDRLKQALVWPASLAG